MQTQHTSRLSVTQRMSQALTQSPARTAVGLFIVVISVFAALLSLPFASATGQITAIADAFMTATSAVTVTGLTPLGPEYFSFAGQVVLLVAIQIGGLGIVTLGAWLTLLVSRRLSLRTRLISVDALGVSKLAEVPALLATVAVFTLTLEAILASVMFPIFFAELGTGDGIFHAIFYAVSAFSNAGFTLSSIGLEHPLVLATINIGVFAGALGFPVVYMLYRFVFSGTRLNLHTRLTLQTTVALLLGGAVLIGFFEWNNPHTLGQLSGAEKLQHMLFSSQMTRSGGFSTYDVTAQHGHTLLITNMLMFIGGGSGSTAGGIKVTTLAVLLLAIVAELRGAEHLRVHRREIPATTVRVALAVVAASAMTVFTAVIALTAVTGETLEVTLFEALSAFGTVGLTTGLSSSAPEAGKWVLTVLMLVGRVGILTFAAGLATQHKPTLYRYPTERPIIG